MAVDPRNHPYLFPPAAADRFSPLTQELTLDTNGRLKKRDKNTAAEILMREGWSFEEVATVLGYVEGGDRT